MRTYFCAILTTLFVMNMCHAAPSVPSGFVVEKFLDRIDGRTLLLETIRNPAYGQGIIGAMVYKNSGILKVFKISQSSIEVIATKSGYQLGLLRTVCFDTTGLFDNKLFISVTYGNQYHERTDILQIDPDGTVSVKKSIGSPSDKLSMRFAFSSGTGGYLPGVYLEDVVGYDGTSLYHMGTDYALTRLKQNWVPAGRADMDVKQIKFDSTGLYGNYLTMADTDLAEDWTVIYQLLPDLSWKQLTTKVRTSVRRYRDMCFNSTGSFEPMLYVTEGISNTVMTVDPNGIHEVFASGFNAVESLTIDQTGEFMYVSDDDGIWQIRAETTEPGPQIIMQEPKVPYDDVFTGQSGISFIRFLWNQEIQFADADVEILNEDGEPVLFSVSGSGSPFMIVILEEPLLNNVYTITIKDSVVSAQTGNPIDGDEDGYAGGNAMMIMEHRERHDSDNDNDIDLNDFAELAEKWLWSI